jgi:hypothetical protein
MSKLVQNAAIVALKKRAKNLRARAEYLQIPMSSTQSLELLAASEYDRSWNVMEARYQHGKLTSRSEPLHASVPTAPNILLLARPGYGKSMVCCTLALAYAHRGEKTLVIAGYPKHPLLESKTHVDTYDISSWCDLSEIEIRHNYSALCATFAQSGKKILVLYFGGSLSRETKSTTPCLNTITAIQLEDNYIQWDHLVFDDLPYIYDSTALYNLSKHYHTILSTSYIEQEHVLQLITSTTFNKRIRGVLSLPHDDTTAGQIASLIWRQGAAVEAPRDMWFSKITDLINAVLSTQEHWNKNTDPVDAFVEHAQLDTLIELAPRNKVVQDYLASLGKNSDGTFNRDLHEYSLVHISNVYRSIQCSRPWHAIEISDAKPNNLLDGLNIAYTHINYQTSLVWSLQWSALEVSLSAYSYQCIQRLHRSYVDFARCVHHDPVLLDICTKAINRSSANRGI